MAKLSKFRPPFGLASGSLLIWLNTGQALAHSDEATAHGHRDWRLLIIVGACLLAFFGVLGIWRWRHWARQHQQPKAFVPPPIGLPTDDDEDD